MTTELLARLRSMVEEELRQVLAATDAGLAGFYGMMHYHMGWVDADLRPLAADGGKGIRPLLCLLACQAVGGSAEMAVPLAAAVELLHNFSLIHDDIEDQSTSRRHRATLWTLWGQAQAINAGDAMFALARLALGRVRLLAPPPDRVLQLYQLFDETCLRLTQGQYLDMGFEERMDVTVDEYLTMIEGKTGALLSASLHMGSLIGGASPEVSLHLANFGFSLGRAFQIQDDLLGIWGDEAMTGKSAQSDILTRKKTLPIVYALSHPQVGTKLARLYSRPLAVSQVPMVLGLLAQVDAQHHALEAARQAHQNALDELALSGVLDSDNWAGQVLLQMAEDLSTRRR